MFCLSLTVVHLLRGPGSSVGMATELRDGPSGIESLWGRDFPPVQTGPGAHPDSCKMGTESFPGVKCGRGVLQTTHPLLVPRSWNSRAKPLPTLWAAPGLYRENFNFYQLHQVAEHIDNFPADLYDHHTPFTSPIYIKNYKGNPKFIE